MDYRPPFNLREYKRIYRCKQSHFSDIIEEMRRADTPDLIEALEKRMHNLLMQ